MLLILEKIFGLLKTNVLTTSLGINIHLDSSFGKKYQESDAELRSVPVFTTLSRISSQWIFPKKELSSTNPSIKIFFSQSDSSKSNYKSIPYKKHLDLYDPLECSNSMIFLDPKNHLADKKMPISKNQKKGVEEINYTNGYKV